MSTLLINCIVKAKAAHFLRSAGEVGADISFLDPWYGMSKADQDVVADYDASLLRDVMDALKPSGTAYVFGTLLAILDNWSIFPSPKRLLILNVTNRVVPKCKSWQSVCEGVVMLTKSLTPFFDRDAVREPYSPNSARQRGRRRPATPGRFGNKESRYSDAAGALPRDLLRGPGLSGRVGARESLGHPCQKPLWLAERLIKASCPPGGLVLDLYAGTSTFSAAAHRLGRQWISVEQDEHWCQVSLKRLRDAGAETKIVVPSGPEALSDLMARQDRSEAAIVRLNDIVARLSTVVGDSI